MAGAKGMLSETNDEFEEVIAEILVSTPANPSQAERMKFNETLSGSES